MTQVLIGAVLLYFGTGEIEYINFPSNLENQYQAFTEADITNLRSVGYQKEFTKLEKGILEYLNWISNQAA